MLGSRSSNSNNSMASDQSESPFPEDDSGQGLTDDDIPF
jgi:single-strand DNA-binding protein